FLQFKEGIDGATDLWQTSIVSYKNKFPSSFQVDLVSVVHLADEEYVFVYFGLFPLLLFGFGSF
ncbi:hypothetical protein L195_g041880, partial [Trifolium pratense]